MAQASAPAIVGVVVLVAGIALASNAVVLAGGLVLIGGTAWFFWGPEGDGYRAPVATRGYQEAMVLVKGGYTPDVIIVEHGKPVRLNFRREESASCSEIVLLGAFDRSARLPEGRVVPVEFLPERPGEYEFACQTGMLCGKLVVE
ncbi:MAG TPA: cupredoxin domain-containing protein [Rubrobacter sp.]|nr:cupredoxin domain-containing protein [Rubrobacter sp.]